MNDNLPQDTDAPQEPRLTARDYFRRTMARRRMYATLSAEYAYLTRAARKYVWLMRGIPTTEWTE